MGEPVHYATEPYRDEIDWGGPGWYFWTETWADRIGPFPTKETAEEACRHYAETL